ncbi:hypothetical protein M8C21_024034 [Ambrosia artemisiifolia]|uniref:Telomerase reverse transcriptase n=1 Tax=Ambrosia artemisiifolia TaxID=4212 RepID=A0AAD5GLS2_AMBAR|nr:hypothetical protein M8C21_024034 [Ambrosia artemisiifolia]
MRKGKGKGKGKGKRRVPEVLWKVFGKRAQRLGEALLSLIPCGSMSFLLRQDDPSDYRTLLNHCFIVFSHTSTPPPFHYHYHSPPPPPRYTQIQLVSKTIQILLSDDPSTNNLICTAYNKHTRSSPVLQALSSSSWNLLLTRVGDDLMVHLLKYSSIFVPLNTNKHQQVAGFPITHLCWQHLKHISHSNNNNNNHRHSDSETFHGHSTTHVHLSQNTQQNGVLSRKRLRSHACRRKRKRSKLSSHYICATKTSLPDKVAEVNGGD